MNWSFRITRSTHLLLPLLLLGMALLVTPFAGHADDHKDQDRARQALLQGKVMSLRDVLDIVQRDFPGEPVEIEFEEDDGMFMYEIKLIQAPGTIVELDVDARNGDILRVKSRGGNKGKGD